MPTNYVNGKKGVVLPKVQHRFHIDDKMFETERLQTIGFT